MKTIPIDVRFDGGKVRVKKHTGVTDRRTANDMRAMLRTLWRQPQHRHLVLEVARSQRDLFELYTAHVEGRLADLSAPFDDEELLPLVERWRGALQVSESHRTRLGQVFTQLLRSTRGAQRLSDLPALVEDYRARCVREGHPRAFNYCKQGALALLRDRVGRRHALWIAVADIASMPEAKQGVLGMSVEEARAVRQRLAAITLHPHGAKQGDRTMGEQAAAIWWSMCCSGMGATEMWGEWTVLPDRVRIRGTKRPGRRWGSVGRQVPLVGPLVRPEMTADRFAKLLRRVGASPYQARKCFACWCEDAEIPRTRRRMYLGHGVRDVTDLYEKREVTAFLAEDRERLRRVIGDGENDPRITGELPRFLPRFSISENRVAAEALA